MRRSLKAAARASGLLRAALVAGDRVKLRRSGTRLVPARAGDDRFLVLIFHRIVAEEPGLRIDALPVAAFDAMARYLSRRFQVLGLDVILDRLDRGLPLPRRALAITFDDGYEDNVANALPVLKRHGLTATFFLTAGCVERGEPLWFDRVLHAFGMATSGARFLATLGEHVRLGSPGERMATAVRCLVALKAHRAEDRDARVRELAAELGVAIPDRLPSQLMSWDQARRLVVEGMALGSHSMTHPTFSTLSDDEARREIEDSRSLIEARTGAAVRLFAYPYGKPTDYTEATADIVRRARYDGAVSTSLGPNAGAGRRFELRRIPPMGDDVADLATTLAQYHLAAAGE